MSRKIPAWMAAAATAMVAVVAGGAVAIGALPDSKGRINACYVKHGDRKGDVRLLVSGKCRRGEQKVSWNQEGQRGEPGESAATNVVIRRSGVMSCRSGAACTRSTFRAHCQPGERATGGGARVTSNGDRVLSDEPLAYGNEFGPSVPTAWEATVDDGGGGDGVAADVSVVCASP